MMWLVDVPGPKTADTPIRDNVSPIFFWNDAAQDDQYVVHSLFAQQPHDFRQQLHVGSRKDAQPQDGHILLRGGLHHHPWGLTDTRVDHLHAGIPQGTGDHLRSAVVSVQSRLGYEDSNRVSALGGHKSVSKY